MNRNGYGLGLCAFGAALLALGSTAQAELEECGNVFLSADASCEFQPTQECMESCETVAVETSCAAELYTDCESECTATATTECESECVETCSTDCSEKMEADDEPNCMGLCMSHCERVFDDKCADADSDRQCRASCSYTCSDRCQAKCMDEPDTVEECEPSCETSCTGSCEARANLDCQVMCQTEVFTECETELVEKCETECMTTGGAIFCDGQFLNYSSVDDCAAELADELEIEVDVDVEASVDIDTDVDEDDDGEGGADAGMDMEDDDVTLDEVADDAGCSVSGSPGAGSSGLSTVLLSGLALLLGARRRHQRL